LASKNTLAEAFDLEDLDSVGYISYEGLLSAFTVLETVPKELQDFIAYFMFKESLDPEKFDYRIILNLLEEGPKLSQSD
jgi:Ca2+-binding EF-hand superfamily protein